ncbi:MAG: hypothetical protein K1X94_06740 [Sandaracinaceae bacterium]|nr:hypothetical protein [Sandaracinaceae bacterium]
MPSVSEEASMEVRAFTATDAIAYGWSETKPRLGSLFVVLGFLTWVLGALESAAQRHGHALVHLVLQLLGMLVTIGWWRISLRLHDTHAATIEALREVTLLEAVQYAITIALYWIATILGLIALVLPGIVIGARLCLAPAIVVDEHRDPLSALRRSWELTEGQTVPVLVLGVMLALLNLLGAIPLGLGLIVTMPITFLAVVHVYRRLAQHHTEVGGYRTAAV